MWFFKSPSVRVQSWVFFVNISSEMIINLLSVWLAYFTVSSDLIISDLPFFFFLCRGTSIALTNTSWILSAHILARGTSSFVLFESVFELHWKSCELSIVCISNFWSGAEGKTVLTDLTNAIIYLMYNLCGRNSSRHDYTPPFNLINKDHLVFNNMYSDVNKLSNLFATCKKLRASCRFWLAFISNWYCMFVVLIITFYMTLSVR